MRRVSPCSRFFAAVSARLCFFPHQGAAFSLLFLFMPMVLSQSAPVAPPSTPATSLAAPLLRASQNQKQLHIFYVHGMAANGENDFDSWGLRKSICDFYRDCVDQKGAGQIDGPIEYADQGPFALNHHPPDFHYLDNVIWPLDHPGSDASEAWNASAP